MATHHDQDSIMADLDDEFEGLSQESAFDGNVECSGDNNEDLESSMSIKNNASNSPTLNGSVGKENDNEEPIDQSMNLDNEGGDNETKEKVDDTTDGRRLEIEDMADDLYDPSLGYLVESNIKNPVKGFLEEEEDKIFAQIYGNSTVLIDIVRKLEKQETDRITKLLKSYIVPVEVPRGYFKIDGGSDIYLKYLSSDERQERAIRLRKSQKVILYDPKCTSYPPHIFELYKKPFELGWKREYVMRSNTGIAKKTGDVYYYPPDGGKLRSSRELLTYLSKNPQHSMLGLDHFSFSKLPVGINDTTIEMVRTAYDGKESLFRKGGPLPNRKSIAFSAKNPAVKRKLEGPPYLAPQVKRSSSSISSTPNSAKMINTDSPSTVSVKSSSSRRSIQPPKRYAGVNQPQEKRQRAKREREESFEDGSLMEMGMLPPQFEDSQLGSGKNPEYIPEVRKRGRPFSKFDPRQMNEFNYAGGGNSSRSSGGLSKGRGRKAGGRSGGDVCPESYEGDGMFQISAIHKNHQSMLFSAMGNLENEKAWKANSSASGSGAGSQNIAEDGELLPSKTEELLPCSIRCPGMTGDVPTLQCRRCLCLYHPECLDYPANILIPDFICSNCDEGGIQSPMNSPVNTPVKICLPQQIQMAQNQGKKSALGKQLGMKQANIRTSFPAQLVRANKSSSTAAAGAKYRPPNMIPPRIPQLQQAEASRSTNRVGLNHRSSMVNSAANDSISQISKRGRGRPPKGKSLISNLTITPISQQRKVKVPSVPKLNPVSVRPYSTNMGLRGIPVSMPAPHKEHIISQTQVMTVLPVPGKRTQAAVLFKKYPQSVVTIGQKQFIAIPNLSSPVLSSIPKNPTSSTVSVSKVKNGNKSAAPAPAPTPALPVLAKKSVVSFTGSDNNGDASGGIKATKSVLPFGDDKVKVIQDMTIEKVDEEKVVVKEPAKCNTTLRMLPSKEEYLKEHPEEREQSQNEEKNDESQKVVVMKEEEPAKRTTVRTISNEEEYFREHPEERKQQQNEKKNDESKKVAKRTIIRMVPSKEEYLKEHPEEREQQQNEKTNDESKKVAKRITIRMLPTKEEYLKDHPEEREENVKKNDKSNKKSTTDKVVKVVKSMDLESSMSLRESIEDVISSNVKACEKEKEKEVDDVDENQTNPKIIENENEMEMEVDNVQE